MNKINLSLSILVLLFSYTPIQADLKNDVLDQICINNQSITMNCNDSQGCLQYFRNNYYPESTDNTYSKKIGDTLYVYTNYSAAVCFRFSPNACEAANIGPGSNPSKTIQMDSPYSTSFFHYGACRNPWFKSNCSLCK